MKHMTLDMPYVAGCSASECAFNVNNNCHAKASPSATECIPVATRFLPSRDTHMMPSEPPGSRLARSPVANITWILNARRIASAWAGRAASLSPLLTRSNAN